jgi:hypothetical protein
MGQWAAFARSCDDGAHGSKTCRKVAVMVQMSACSN